MSFLINPYAFLAAGGDFESIETVTLSNSTTASVTFSSLSGYQHLQIRGIMRNTRGAYSQASGLGLRFNGDTGNNYASHRLRGTGSATDASASTSASGMYLGDSQSDLANADIYTAVIIDILDYGSTSKNTTARSFWGADTNDTTAGRTGTLAVASGFWNSTNAVTSLTLFDAGGYYFKADTTFALYGIKAP